MLFWWVHSVLPFVVEKVGVLKQMFFMYCCSMKDCNMLLSICWETTIRLLHDKGKSKNKRSEEMEICINRKKEFYQLIYIQTENAINQW